MTDRHGGRCATADRWVMSQTYLVVTSVAVKVWLIRSGGLGCGQVGDGGSLAAPQPESGDAGGPHQPGDPLVVHRLAAIVAELGGDPGDAAGVVRAGVDSGDLGGQPFVGCLPSGPRRCDGLPVIEARTGDTQGLAQPLHAEVGAQVGNAVEVVHQRVAPAKYFAAFCRISRSLSSSRTRRRSATTSASRPSAVTGAAGRGAVWLPVCRPSARAYPVPQRRGVHAQVRGDRLDRRPGPGSVQGDRGRLELGRVVLHRTISTGLQPSDPQDPSVSGVQHPWSGPSASSPMC